MRAEEVILVTGATGHTGSALLEQLEGRGARVRAMVRRPPDGGRLRRTSATIVVGDFHDPRSEVTGTEPRDVRTFARDYVRAFVGV
jgi:uncharacterized protein YbjT (DUF2867 family)